jgi:hypothetical protein
MESTPPSAPRPARRRRAVLVLGMVLALVAAPAIVLASHQFSDVPTSSPFHANIARLVDTGITAGCGSGRFCPKSAVTREQMAAFLTRGLGTTAASYTEIPLEDSATTYAGAIGIRAGGTSGGTGYITVTADVSVFVTDPTICPCGIQIGIDQLDGPGTSPQTVFVVAADELEGAQANAGTVQWVFQVPSGASAEFGVYADVFTQPVVTGIPVSAGTILATMTAEYSPFGSTTVFAPTSEGGFQGFGEPRTDIKERSVPR